MAGKMFCWRVIGASSFGKRDGSSRSCRQVRCIRRRREDSTAINKMKTATLVQSPFPYWDLRSSYTQPLSPKMCSSNYTMKISKAQGTILDRKGRVISCGYIVNLSHETANGFIQKMERYFVSGSMMMKNSRRYPTKRYRKIFHGGKENG